MVVTKAQMDAAMSPRTVAVVGAKKDADYSWLKNMTDFKGKVYSVQLDPNEIPGIEELGFDNYTSLMEIPEPVDYVVVAVPRRVAPRHHTGHLTPHLRMDDRRPPRPPLVTRAGIRLTARGGGCAGGGP